MKEKMKDEMFDNANFCITINLELKLIKSFKWNQLALWS